MGSCSSLFGSAAFQPVLVACGAVHRDSPVMDSDPMVDDRGKRKCAQCAHLLLRTGPYAHRTGPDSACFRYFPAITRPRIAFESHLGHGIPPRQRGFLL